MTEVGAAPTVGEAVGEGVGRIAGFVNSYVVRDASGTYLVDTGFSSRAAAIRRAFDVARLPLSTVTHILLTHWHPDHIGGASRVEAASRAVVACHPADAPVVEGKVPPPGPKWMRIFARPRPVAVGRPVQDGERLGPFRVWHLPGHTPGSVAFYLPERRALFTGDAVVERKGRLALGPTRYAWDVAKAHASLARLEGLPVEVLLPGHGDPVRGDVPSRLAALAREGPPAAPG
jgi:glyoxylase-like metal-dependent hydrolase (beta-lactamase superfamily II)